MIMKRLGVAAGFALFFFLSAGPARAGVNVMAWGWNQFGQTNVPVSLTNAVAVAAGGYHSLALRADGTVVVWGDTFSGQNVLPPGVGIANGVAIAAGLEHSLVLRADGTVTAWGGNGHGQTNVPAGLTGVVAVAAGGYHNLALLGNGTVTGWGRSSYGQTTPPAGLTNVVAVAAGEEFSLALRSDGTVAAWGFMAYGATAVPADLSNVVAIAAGQYHSLALCSDGTVRAWGREDNGAIAMPFGLTNVTAVSAGENHSMALRADGTVESWGRDAYGAADPPFSLSNVVALSATYRHSMALTGWGRPVLAPLVRQTTVPLTVPVFLKARAAGERPLRFSWNKDGVPVAGATNALLVIPGTNLNQAGAYSCVASNARGVATGAVVQVRFIPANVVSWGWNLYRQLRAPADAADVVAVSAGYGHTLALRYGGRVVAWGYDSDLQTTGPGGTTNALAVAAGFKHSLALKANRSVQGWGDNGSGQALVPSRTTNVTAVSAGYDHSLVLFSDGTVRAWGSASQGQSDVPAGLTNVVAVAAGYTHSLALKADGTVAGWGALPGGSNAVARLSNVVAVAAGMFHDMALRDDGTVLAWGEGADALTNVPAGLGRVSAIAAGTEHCLALREDGTVAAWGDDSFGQRTVPGGFSNGVAVAAGTYHSVAVIGAGQPFLPPMTNRIEASMGVPVFFRAAPTGERPLRCAWQKDGVPLAGQTNAVLKVTPSSDDQAGAYRCVVSNALGVATGEVIRLTIRPAGALRVAIAPAGAVLAGARWRVDNGLWRTNGEIATDLATGRHAVAYSGVVCWLTPATQAVVVLNREMAATTGVYTAEAVSAPPSLWGTAFALTNQWMFYTTGGSVDNAGHAVEYRFGFTGKPLTDWSSGVASCSWAAAGAYGVKSQARCVDGHATSEWSAVRTVYVTNSVCRGMIYLSSGSFTGREGAVTKVRVYRYFGSVGRASVDYKLKGKTALAGQDYVVKSGTLTWTNGDLTSRVIKLVIPADRKKEGNEQFQIVLTRPVGGMLIAPSKATITILANNKSDPAGQGGESFPQAELAGALDYGAIWLTSRAAPWLGQSAVTADGVDAAVSGNAGTSWLESGFEGSGTLEFDWLVKGSGGDACLVFVDGGVAAVRKAGAAWAHESVELGAGSHLVRWVYVGDDAVAPGAAYLDRVEWTPGE